MPQTWQTSQWSIKLDNTSYTLPTAIKSSPNVTFLDFSVYCVLGLYTHWTMLPVLNDLTEILVPSPGSAIVPLFKIAPGMKWTLLTQCGNTHILDTLLRFEKMHNNIFKCQKIPQSHTLTILNCKIMLDFPMLYLSETNICYLIEALVWYQTPRIV